MEYELKEGESILMPAKHPHAVYGKDQFKMLLTVVFWGVLGMTKKIEFEQMLNERE